MRKIFIEGGLIIPILLGILSVAGLCVILLFGRLNNSRQVIPTVATETPFRYIYMGTEPNTLEPTLEQTETALDDVPTDVFTKTPEATATPHSLQPTPTTIATLRPTNTANSIVLGTNTPTRTLLPAYTTTPGFSMYDDTDSRLAYIGSWNPQNSISGVFQNTLHVSDTTGDSVSFSFTGQLVQITYQAGPSLGVVTITLDGLNFTLIQSDTTTKPAYWVSGTLIQATHTVIVTHTGGGSINIDAVLLPNPPTATPTRTP